MGRPLERKQHSMANEKDGKEENGGMKKVAAFIVDKRNLFFLLYVVALVFSLFSRNWVEVENDITTYLPDDTETRQGLTVMNDNFVTYGSARVMIANITPANAQALADQIEDIDGVSRVTFDNTQDHYRGASALIDVSFDAEEMDDRAIQAMNSINSLWQTMMSMWIPRWGRTLPRTWPRKLWRSLPWLPWSLWWC